MAARPLRVKPSQTLPLTRAADGRVEACERVRADAEPVEPLEQRPAREGEREAAPLEAARGGDDAGLGLHEPPLPPQRAEQIQVFKDGERLEAARALVRRAPDEDARVAVGQPQQTQPRVEPRQEPRRRGAAVEAYAEVPAGGAPVSERGVDARGR